MIKNYLFKNILWMKNLEVLNPAFVKFFEQQGLGTIFFLKIVSIHVLNELVHVKINQITQLKNI